MMGFAFVLNKRKVFDIRASQNLLLSDPNANNNSRITYFHRNTNRKAGNKSVLKLGKKSCNFSKLS
jgi:hypothetical protein